MLCMLSGILSCSESIISPGISRMKEIPSAVAKPSLRRTLPASWDENWFASVAVFDLDNDGENEIIAARHSVLYVWDKDGKLAWRAPAGENASTIKDHAQSRIYCSPAVGDFDNDGKGEIAIVYSNKVAVYDHNGNLEIGWPQSFPGSSDEIRSLTVQDLDNDGNSEVVVVKTSSGPVTCIWHIDGRVKAGWPQVVNNSERNNFGGYNQNAGIADVNDDGVLEVIATYDICHIGIMKPDGSELLANPIFKGKYASSVPMFHDLELAKQGWGKDGSDRDEFTDSPPAFADIDGDGDLEIVLFSDHERAGEYKNRGNSLWVLNHDMTRVRGFEKPFTTGMPVFTGYQQNIVAVNPSPCISSLDNRGPHIIVPSTDGFLYCFSSDGEMRWNIQFGNSGTAFTGCSEVVAGDLDNDGVSEIVFCTYSTEQGQSHMFIVNCNGQLLHRVSISGRGSMAAPTLADIDADGILEIIISLKDTLGKGSGGVQIWDVSSAKAGKLDWPTGRGNYKRTGRSEI